MAEGATVSGVSFEASNSLEYAEPEDEANLGTVANVNAGTIENCSSAIAYNQIFAKFPGKPVNIGGIVGSSTGLVKGCSNTGARTIEITAPTKSTFHTFGGIVGFFSGAEGKVMVKDCSNSGAISTTIGTACYMMTAGVAGSTNLVKQLDTDPVNQGIVEGCSNTGAISARYIAGGSGAYPSVGGVCGQIEGVIKDCTNSGALSLKCDSPSATWTCMRVGGVASYACFGATNCTNKVGGTITVDALVAGGTAGAKGAANVETSSWGGVLACAGPYKPNKEIVFEKLTNEAEINFVANSITGTPNHNVGAVVGVATGTLKDCHNKGNFTFKSPVAYTRFGGVVADTKCDVIGCTNSGNITLNIGNLAEGSSVIGTKKFAGYVGGIIGSNRLASEGNTITIKDCVNSGTLKLDASEHQAESMYLSYVAGIIAVVNPSFEPSIEGCSNTGKLEKAGDESKIKIECVEIKGGKYQEEIPAN